MTQTRNFLQARQGRTAGWVVVALVHLALLALLIQARHAQQAAPAADAARGQWVTMRLLSRPSLAPRPKPAAAGTVAKAAVPTQTGAAPLPPRGERSSPEPSSPNAMRWVPAAPATAPTATVNAGPSTAPDTSVEASARAPLQLDMPGRAASGALPSPAEMARRDPRSNTRRLDVGERIAKALGQAEVSEEAVRPGLTRFRQGSGCIDVQDTRVSQLFAFDEVARGTPKLVSACKK